MAGGPVDVQPLIAGRYELHAVIGRGGTADVHRARDRVLERDVAVKLFAQGVTGPDRHRQDTELQTLARLQHPGLIELYDAGTHEGRAYLVMQLVEGPPLSDRLRAGPLPPPDVVSIGAQLADTLAYVHSHGVTHRDIKPANVLLGANGSPLLGDFGIARLVDTTRVTATGHLVGTAAYMAPEQVRGIPVGSAADVYSLGLVVLETVTGRREYPGSAMEAAVARLHRTPQVPEGLPGGLTPLLGRMTATDPADRPTAVEVTDALRGESAELGVTADVLAYQPTAVVAAAPTATAPDASPNAVPPTRVVPPPQPRRRRGWGLLLVAVAAALAIAGGLLVPALFDAGSREPNPEPRPAPVTPVAPSRTGEPGTEPAPAPSPGDGGAPAPAPEPGGVAPAPAPAPPPVETTTETTPPTTTEPPVTTTVAPTADGGNAADVRRRITTSRAELGT